MTVSLQDKFDQINDHARLILYDLLREWFPLGRMISKTEYGVGNLNGDEGESLSINIHTSRWKDFAGGPGGHEPLSIYAHAFCNGDRKQAFKELRAKFGFSDDAPPPRRKPVLKVVPKDEPKDDWQSMVPPPDGVGKPDIRGNIPVYVYLGADGKPLRYVTRHLRADGSKYFIPHTYGTSADGTKWHEKHPNNPMCLYGLDRLAARPNARVLLQEGEQKSDDCHDRLGDGWACLGWSGGANRATDHDYSVLAGRDVTICPDADDPSRKAAAEVARILAGIGCTVHVADNAEMPKGWDLGNACTGKMDKKGVTWEDTPWTGEQIEAFLKKNSHIEPPDLGDVDPEPGEPDTDDEDPDGVGGIHEGIVPLGHDKNIHYYLSRSSGQVVGLTPARHVELELIGLADPEGYWYKMPALKKEDGGVNWKKAAAWLMKWSKKQGIYKPDRIRGRGAWLDQGRAVLHLGESLIVEGVWQKSLSLPGRPPFVYEAAGCLGLTIAPPLRNAEAHKLLKMCELLRWEKDISAVLAAGWIAIAPICGVLLWRPSIWITGSSNSGKTTFLRDIIAPILGRGLDDGIAVNAQSKTTEAGIRQMLGSDARPVIFDEAEAEMLNDKTRMQAVIDLNRQSSSEGGAEIIKGTQNQSGAKRYRIRSCFLYSSINVALDHLADESRITVLDLYNPGPAEMERDRQRWGQLQALMAETVTDPLWCAGMVARSVLLMKTIRANAAIFKLAVAEVMNSSRVGDQLGTLLAGAYSLHSDREITLDEARAYVARHDWSNATSAEAVKDEQRLLSHLMQQRIRIELGDNKTMDRTVHEAIAIAHDEAEAVAGMAQAALKRCGIKLEEDGVWFSNTHNALKGWLKETPWSSQWGRSLKRLPGAKSSDPKTIAFGKYDKTKAVWLPLDALEG